MKLLKKISAAGKPLANPSHESNYKLLLDRISDGFFSLDKDQRYTYANSRIGEMTKINPESLSGKYIWDVFPGAIGSETYKAIHKALEEQKYVCNVDYYPPLDLWQENHIYPSADGLSVFIRDISESKRLNAEHALLASIVNSSDDAIISKDLNGTITSWNSGAEKLFGYTAAEALGKNIREFIPTNRLSEENEIIGKIKRGLHIKHYETQRLRKDGSLIYISLTVSPIIDSNGTITGASKVARDITEKKLSEERVRYSETNLSTIIENSTEAFILMDKDLLIKAFNKKAKESILLQFGKENIKEGSLFTDHIHKDRREHLQQVLQQVMKGETVQYESDFYKVNDISFWFRASFIPVKENNIVTGICIAVKDITHRKNSENKIIQSEENLRAIFENTTQGFLLLDTNGVIKLWNSNAIKYSYIAYGKVIEAGKRLHDFIEPSRVEFLEEAFVKVLRKETVQYSRFYREGPEGPVWLDFSISPVINDGEVTGICITGNDITEKKRMQAELEFDQKNVESMINNTDDLMWSIDTDFRLITFNKPFEKYVFNTAGITIAKGSSVLISKYGEQKLSAFTALYQRAFAGEAFTETMVTSGNPGSYVEISFYPIYQEDKVIGTACFCRDISKQVQNEEKIAKNIQEKEMLIHELSQNNKDLRQFTYITSHNLRGPIANLLGLCNLLDNYSFKDPTLTTILDGIKKASNNFDDTIKDLSSILKIKDNPSVPQEMLSFSASFEKVVRQCDRIVKECEATIKTNFQEALLVNFNKAYLESIFINLLTNALKYRNYRQPLNIEVTTKKKGDYTVLLFSDNGVGLNVELHKDKLFQLYQRFHNDRDGKGMGLFLIKSQLETLGGSIEIDSKPGMGTTFQLYFKN